MHETRRYLLTGASGGLGLATAHALVRGGGSAIVSGRDASRVEAAVAELGSRAQGLVGDLADPAFVSAALDRGPFDGCLVSVGGPPAGRALDVTDEQWRTSFDTVFLGAVRLIRALAEPGRLTPGSAIGLVLSTSARTSLRGLSISNGLRPGLAMLVSDIAEEIGPRGLRIVGLLPGRFDTDRVRSLDDATGDPAAVRARFAEAIPLGRYGDPAEFGAVAAFMLSREASYVTGTCITIDGGLTPLP